MSDEELLTIKLLDLLGWPREDATETQSKTKMMFAADDGFENGEQRLDKDGKAGRVERRRQRTPSAGWCWTLIR